MISSGENFVAKVTLKSDVLMISFFMFAQKGNIRVLLVAKIARQLKLLVCFPMLSKTRLGGIN